MDYGINIFSPIRIKIPKIRLYPGFLLNQIIGITAINAKTSTRHGEKTPSTKKVKGITKAIKREFETLFNPFFKIELSINLGKKNKKIPLMKNVANPIKTKTGINTVISVISKINSPNSLLSHFLDTVRT